ncbi:MAG: PA2169 family four-helix-bundle protein [Proteobacteria bacterium]|nr:PA2169 family four-helix-bundle protein [Pseudomonadota bacterium]
MSTQNIRDEKIETINELLAVTRDSAEFYEDASTKARNPQLQSLFKDMAQSKNSLVGAMSREVKAEGATPDTDGTFRGTLHRMYGDVRGKMGSDDYGYVAQLEESEDRMLHAFNEVLEDKDAPVAVKDAVRSFLPTVKQQHDTMRDRKWAMDATKH